MNDVDALDKRDFLPLPPSLPLSSHLSLSFPVAHRFIVRIVVSRFVDLIYSLFEKVHLSHPKMFIFECFHAVFRIKKRAGENVELIGYTGREIFWEKQNYRERRSLTRGERDANQGWRPCPDR